MIISILVRRLKEGKTYEDFREAWLPDKPFGVPTRVVSAQRLEDPRDIVTIGFSDMSVEDMEGFLERVGTQEQVRHERIDDVIEGDVTRYFYVQVGDDDLTDEAGIDAARRR
jgi:hypothetical protein